MGGRVHLGDLLRALHSAPGGGELWAAQAAGFALRAEAPSPAATDGLTQLAQSLLDEMPQPEARLKPEPPEEPQPTTTEQDATAQAPVFWRVRSIEPKPNSGPIDLPEWLKHAPAPLSRFLTDPSQPRPPRPWLHTPGHWAKASRACLSRPQTVAQWCERRLADVLAQGRSLPPAHQLRRQLRRWPHRLQVVQDLDERQWPLNHEFDHWLAQLHKHLGQRLALQRVRGLPSATVGAGPAVRLDGSPVLVFGDLGLDETGHIHPDWATLGRRITEAGGQAWVWWPGMELCDAAQAAGWRPWPIPHAAGTRQRADAARTLNAPVLACAIWGNPHISPGLLRRLRLAACSHGFDLAVQDEVRFWHSDWVWQDAYACRLRDEAAQAVLAEWHRLPSALRQSWVALHLQHLGAASPLVRAEFAERMAQAFGTAAELIPALQQARQEAEALMQAAVVALRQPEGALPEQLQAFVRRQGQRAPDLPEQASPPWQWAWGVSHQAEWQAIPAQRPSWMTAELWEQITGEALPQVRQSLCVHGIEGGAQLVIEAGETERPRIASFKDRPQALYQVEPEPLLRRQARALARKSRAELREFLFGSSQFYPAGNDQEVLERKASLEACQLALLDGRAGLTDAGFEAWEQEFLAWRRAMAVHVGAAQLDHYIDDAADSLKFIDRFSRPAPKPVSSSGIGLPAKGSVRLEWPQNNVVVEPFIRPTWMDEVWCENGLWRGLTPGEESLVWLPEISLGLSTRPQQEKVRFPAAWWPNNSLAAINGNKTRHVSPPHSGKSFLEFMHQAWGPLLKPAWAEAHGIDQHGWWATWQLGDAPPQRMRFIPPGEFWMGSPQAEEGRYDAETLHPVTLTQGFWLGETTVSNALWQVVTERKQKGPALHPRVNVSWDNIHKEFLPKLRRKAGHQGWGLPTEAQWEYAARAGTSTAYPWGDTPDKTRMNIGSKLMPVDEGCPPNPWGLLHMHGNVWEWCQDKSTRLGAEHALDPMVEDSKTSERVLRGGSWLYVARGCRSAMRDGSAPSVCFRNIGFRLARGLEPAVSPAEQGASQGAPQGRPEAGPPASLGRGGGVEQGPKNKSR